jgi:hypothetical protein
MTDKTQKSGTDNAVKTPELFGPNNLAIVDGPETVTMSFDPRRIIGQFKSGNPQVCSTGAYRTLDISGVRVMIHVIGRKG